MAIDSEDRRRSIAGIPMVADGDIDDAQDRIHIAGFYRGLTIDAPEVVTKRNRGMLLGVY